MLMLRVIWMTAAAFVALALIFWIALLVTHVLVTRHDRRIALWQERWLGLLLDVLGGVSPASELPKPSSKAEMEAVIGLLRELGERFGGSYLDRLGEVLGQIDAMRFGHDLIRSRNADNRVRGCSLLAWCPSSEKTDSALLRALKDRDPRVVLEASSALVRHGAVEDVRVMTRALCRSKAARSLIARDVMRKWGRSTQYDWSELLDQHWPEDNWILLLEAASTSRRGEWTPKIARLVRHPSPLVVSTALSALEALGDPDGAEAAESACIHDRSDIRRKAAAALAACSPPGHACAVLATMLRDDSFEVRKTAVSHILKLGGAELLRSQPPEDDWQRELFNEAGLLQPAAAS